MEGKDQNVDIFSKRMKASKRRTYFFDVRETKAGDYYLTITESNKNFVEGKVPSFTKSKLFLYKENFDEFMSILKEFSEFIIKEKGHEVIGGYPKDEDESENKNEEQSYKSKFKNDSGLDSLKNLDFDDLK